MREYVVRLEYERGVHPVRDVFIDHPELQAVALTIAASTESGWRIEHVTGPPEALDALEDVYLNPDICNECAYLTPSCDAVSNYEVLESTETARTIYRHTTENTYCHSVSYLAITTLGTGLVFDATQRGNAYEWRMLVPEGRNLRAFRDALLSGLPSGVTFELRRAGPPDTWHHGWHPHPESALPYEQREALEAALRLGYYEYPRRATLDDIATELDLPLTTLRYRLRRAEAAMVAPSESDARPTVRLQ